MFCLYNEKRMQIHKKLDRHQGYANCVLLRNTECKHYSLRKFCIGPSNNLAFTLHLLSHYIFFLNSCHSSLIPSNQTLLFPQFINDPPDMLYDLN